MKGGNRRKPGKIEPWFKGSLTTNETGSTNMQDEDQEEINRYPDKKKYDYQGTRDTSLYDISIIS